MEEIFRRYLPNARHVRCVPPPPPKFRGMESRRLGGLSAGGVVSYHPCVCDTRHYVRVLHIKPLLLPVDIQHNQCPRRFSIDRNNMHVLCLVIFFFFYYHHFYFPA